MIRTAISIDRSHSVGSRERAQDGSLKIFYATAQRINAGANMLLVDFHPGPQKALVDVLQALLLKALPHFLEDLHTAKEAYPERWQLAQG